MRGGARAGSSGACGSLRAVGRLQVLDRLENQLAPCRLSGQRAGRPHRAACSRAQMPLQSAVRLAQPPGLACVTLQHARILPAARCSHPARPLEESQRDAGKPGLRHPEIQGPSGAAGGTRRGRFLGCRGADRKGRRAQRASLSFWPRLSERRERSERSEFRGPTLAGAPQGSRTRSADRPSMSLRRVPPAATRANANAKTDRGHPTLATCRWRSQECNGRSDSVFNHCVACLAPRSP